MLLAEPERIINEDAVHGVGCHRAQRHLRRPEINHRLVAEVEEELAVAEHIVAIVAWALASWTLASDRLVVDSSATGLREVAALRAVRSACGR